MNDDSKIFGQQKILNHPDKIANWLKNNDETLITCEIDMTNNCNSKCPGCVGGRTNRESLTLGQAKNYIDQLKGVGVRGIIFSGGGEPTLNLDTNEVVRYANRSGLDVGFITNGLLLDKETRRVILKNCIWCRISLDAGEAGTYELVHGLDENKFRIVVKNIEALSKEKKLFKSNCTIGVGYLTGKDTARGMLSFAKLAQKLRVDYAQFRPFHDDFTDITKELDKCMEYQGNYSKIVSSAHKYLHFKEGSKRPYNKCYGVNFCTVICADGTVQTCCHTRGKKRYILGDLKEKSFREIWRNRHDIFEKINFLDCGPFFCRADEFNRLLFEIKKDKQHINFI